MHDRTEFSRSRAQSPIRTQDTFADWYQTVREPLVRALVVRCAGDTELAADSVDEALVRALERWNRVGQMDSPEAWTYRVASNLVSRHYRRRGGEKRALARRGPLPDHVAPAEPDGFWPIVAQLKPREREALALRYVVGFSEAEVARALDMAPGSASALLSRARARLRELLPDQPEGTAS
ncbi:MAG: sigma-70 family RNA polymerase sigma factor [Acidimicrobiales bacterium]|nr:sigma-70 family RNA polymerase sigma factor [Acidimicrobiales bacterium]